LEALTYKSKRSVVIPMTVKKKNIPPLEDRNQELVYIAQRYKGERKAKRAIEELLKINAGFIWTTMTKITTVIDFPHTNDILNVCRMSIVKALDSYEFGRNAKFITWWVFYIRAAIQIWRREQSGELYIKQFIQDKKIQATYIEKAGDKARSKRAVKRLKEFESYKDIEIEKRSWDTEGKYEIDLKEITSNSGGVMGSWSIDGFEGSTNGLSNIYKIVNSEKRSPQYHLNKMEIKILDFYYVQGFPLHDIGELLSYSKERIRQIKNIALDKIKYALELDNLTPTTQD